MGYETCTPLVTSYLWLTIWKAESRQLRNASRWSFQSRTSATRTGKRWSQRGAAKLCAGTATESWSLGSNLLSFWNCYSHYLKQLGENMSLLKNKKSAEKQFDRQVGRPGSGIILWRRTLLADLLHGNPLLREVGHILHALLGQKLRQRVLAARLIAITEMQDMARTSDSIRGASNIAMDKKKVDVDIQKLS